MRLTESQSQELLAKHGIYIDETCDECGQILGPVRFTRNGRAGEWCSKHAGTGTRLNPVSAEAAEWHFGECGEAHCSAPMFAACAFDGLWLGE